MTSLKLRLQEMADLYIRRNFELLTNYVNQNHQFESFLFFSRSFSAPGTYSIAHTLGATPKDIVQTRLKGSGTVTWNYDSFTSSLISVTIGGSVTESNPTELRFFLGTYVGD